MPEQKKFEPRSFYQVIAPNMGEVKNAGSLTHALDIAQSWSRDKNEPACVIENDWYYSEIDEIPPLFMGCTVVAIIGKCQPHYMSEYMAIWLDIQLMSLEGPALWSEVAKQMGGVK